MKIICQFIFLSSFFLSAGNLYAQKEDSLTNLSYTTLKDRFDKLKYKAPKKAKIYASALVKKSITENNDIEKHNAFLYQAFSESYFGNLDTSLELIKKSIVYAKHKK